MAGRQWCPFTGLGSRSPRRLPGGAGSSQTLLSPARRLPRASGGPGSKGTPTGARCGLKLPCGAPASGRRGRAPGSAEPCLGRGWPHQTATPGGWRGGVGGGVLEWEERTGSPRPPASPTFHSGFTLARGRGEGAYSASIPVDHQKIIIINATTLHCTICALSEPPALPSVLTRPRKDDVPQRNPGATSYSLWSFLTSESVCTTAH